MISPKHKGWWLERKMFEMIISEVIQLLMIIRSRTR